MSKQATHKLGALATLVLVLTLLASCASNWWEEGKNHYYADFVDVSSLPPGANVLHRGVCVGRVKRVIPHPKNAGLIQVDFTTNKQDAPPKNAIISIQPTGFISNHVITLQYATPCQGADCAPDGYVFPKANTGVKGMSSAFLGDNIMEETFGMDSLWMNELEDGLKARFSRGDSGNVVAHIMGDMQALQQQAADLQSKMGAFTQKYQGKAEDLKADFQGLSGMLNADKTQQITRDLDALQQKMDSWDIQKPIEHAKSTQGKMVGLQGQMAALEPGMDAVMAEAQEVMAAADALKQRMASPEGSMAYLLSEDGLMGDWEGTKAQLDSLSTDFNEKKYLYVPWVCRRKYLRKQARQKAASGE